MDPHVFLKSEPSQGLSTGSIYYHLERMKNYVLKNSKYYVITKEGMDLLVEIDKRKDITLSTKLI